MKIAWFTPFSINSAIGRVGRDICEELSKNYEVDIFTSCEGKLHETYVNIVKFQPEKLCTQDLSLYTHVIYNMGNYAGYHRSIWQILNMKPGIVILHDQTLHSFFRQITTMQEFGGDPENGYKRYEEFLHRYHGDLGVASLALANDESDASFTDTDLIAKFNLLKPVIDNAKAVFTHSRFFAKGIKERFLGLVGYAYLPYETRHEKCETLMPKVLGGVKDKILIVSSGIVHPVKRTDKVVDVLLKNPDIASKVKFVVIGSYGGDYGDKLYEYSQRELKGCLHMLGYLADDEMNSIINRADICVNLRYPNSEACSYSLLEQMAYGKPVIVLNSGFYGEVPKDAVYRINIEDEEYGLEKALRELIDNREMRNSIGENARKFVEEQCSLKIYIKRLIDFLRLIPQSEESSTQLINNSIEETKNIMKQLGFNQHNVPWALQDIISITQDVLTATKEKTEYKEERVLGLWVGFNIRIPGLRREGIMRFLSSLAYSMLRTQQVRCEVWVYSFNEEEIKESFHNILSDKQVSDKFSIITERNWANKLKIHTTDASLPWEVDEVKDNLSELARVYSKAECFIPAIVYLDNVLGTDKPIFVPAHDMAVHNFYEEFTFKDPLYKFRLKDIGYRINRLARSGAFMFCNCNTVRQEQILKYVKFLDERSTEVVYLPSVIPAETTQKLKKQKTIMSKFGIKGRYLFYATQIRPYKNVTTLIRAFSSLTKKYKDLSLVLTGNPKDVLEVDQCIKELGVGGRILLVSHVSESELYSLYKYAAAVPVPTRFEGGFPWQACEALYMDTPVVISNIPIVCERIKSMGFSLDNCGLELFDPLNAKELEDKLELILEDRDSAVNKQRTVKEELLSYNWDDAAKLYYDRMFGQKD